jgi:hypothetical protein
MKGYLGKLGRSSCWCELGGLGLECSLDHYRRRVNHVENHAFSSPATAIASSNHFHKSAEAQKILTRNCPCVAHEPQTID